MANEDVKGKIQSLSRSVYLHIDKHNQEQITALSTLKTQAVYNAELDAYKVVFGDLQRNQTLRDLIFEEAQEAQERLMKARIAHTQEIIEAQDNKIYLNSLNWWDLKTVNDPKYKDVFGHDGKHFYIKKNYAEDNPKWSNFVNRCSKNVMLTGTMFKPPRSRYAPTPGANLLAEALNIPDKATRADKLAEALALCAKEAYLKVPGAITNMSAALMVSNANKKGFDKSTVFDLTAGYFKALAVYKRGNRDLKKSNAPHVIDDLNMEALQETRLAVGQNLQRSFDRRIVSAMKNPDPEVGLALCRKAAVDFTKGMSLECESVMFRSQVPTFVMDSMKFGIRNMEIIKEINCTHQMGPAVQNRLTQLFDFCDRNIRSMQLCMNTGINAVRGVAAQDFYAMQSNLRNNSKAFDAELDQLHLMNVLPERTNDMLAELPFEKDPLFICVGEDDFKEFMKAHSGQVYRDPEYHALCVENTLENQKKFKAYLPREITQRETVSKMPVDHQKSYNKALELLRSRGFDVSKGLVINSQNAVKDKWGNSKKNPSLGYVLKIGDGGCDRVTIFDFNGAQKETVLLQNKQELEQSKLRATEFSPQEKAAYAKAEKFRQENREAISLNAKQLASKFAAKAIKNAVKLDNSVTLTEHSYLAKKELQASDVNGLMFDPTGETTMRLFSGREEVTAKDVGKYAGSLVAPLCNAGGVVKGAQIITEDGTKLFARGASTSGCFFPIGGYDKLRQAEVILIAEGVATAASIQKFAPPGTVVVAAMNCGNIPDVARALSNKFHQAGIGIMADNDVRSAGISKVNAGIEAAYRAKNLLSDKRPNISVCTAPLSNDELSRGMSDFNDAVCHHKGESEERYKMRLVMTQNRIAEACAAAKMNHRMNTDAAMSALDALSSDQKKFQEMENKIMVDTMQRMQEDLTAAVKQTQEQMQSAGRSR